MFWLTKRFAGLRLRAAQYICDLFAAACFAGKSTNNKFNSGYQLYSKAGRHPFE
ncbi:hypothetical protein NIASO_15370 [Niabella soli DSM 19437]|uniref:Uncharacterized protein n=1 Tax=Niabella soli DSM 19437 TaxID=929713 RepID=W0F4C1_9BACT|nr:hypothetical protein NIASO_15370 [Niabella soli DSM 19437]